MINCQQILFEYPGESFRFGLESLSIGDGESVAVTGPSGCGKTTLLRLLAGILLPGEGKIEVAGAEVTAMTERARREHRLSRMGLVFQEFELLDYLSVVDNVLVPYRLAGEPESTENARTLLDRAGIGHLASRFPNELSQGERQRVAICRALVKGPKVILADEPTGNLDPTNKEKLTTLLRDEAAKSGATLVMVTHDVGTVANFEREVRLGELLT